MGSADGFIGVIGQISTLVGFGMELKSIFGGSAPLTIDDIQTAVRQEVTAALSERAFEDEIINASATLQSVQDFCRTILPRLSVIPAIRLVVRLQDRDAG